MKRNFCNAICLSY